MRITQLVGHIDDPHSPYRDADGQIAVHCERVHLDNDALRSRVQRITTDHGREFGLMLPMGHPPLKDGDILHADNNGIVLVQAAASDVLVISPRSVQEMGVVAHTLGNRHLPAQFLDGTMIVQFDSTVVDYLEHVQVPYRREERVMPTPFRHAEHTH